MRKRLLYALLFFWLTACGDEALLGILPSISSITTEKGKAEGPISGKTKVTIRGTHFARDAEVTFGAKKATGVSFQNQNSLLTTTDSVFLSALVSVAVTSGGQIVVKPRAFVYTPLIAFASNRTGSFEIFTMGIDRETPTRLTTSGTGVINESPVYSPDGRNILFSSNQTGDFELFLMSHNGLNPVNLTNNNTGVDQEAVFSPDGKQIVFISNRLDSNPGSDFEIFLIDRDGGNLKQLTTNSTHERNPSFSPDGTRILFSSGPAGNRELFLMNTDGTGLPLQLTNNVNIDDHDPIFSPDGKQILFISNRTGPNENELYIIDNDGGNPIQLTTNQGNTATPAFLGVPTHGIEVLFSSIPTGTNREIFLMSCSGDQARAITSCDEAGATNLSLHTASEISPSPSP